MLNSNKLLKKVILTICIVALCVLISIVFYNTSIQKSMQNSLYDSFFSIKVKLNENSKKTNDIIIVPIDEHSLDVMNQKGIYWPWPRYIYGMLAKHLIKNGAKAVVFDMIFSNPDIDRLDIESGGILYGVDSDGFLNSTIKSDKVFIGYDIDKSSKFDSSLDAIEIKNINNFKNIPVYSSIIKPYYLFLENNKNFGFVEIATKDGIIRNYTPLAKIKNNYYSSLSASIILKYNNNILPEKLNLDKDGSFTINWYGQGGINKTYKYISPISILSDFKSTQNNPDDKILPNNIFKDKIIFIGATARGLLDMKSTPFTKLQAYPGVEIHATAYLNLLYNDWIKKSNPIFEFIIYFIVMLFLIFFWIDTKYPVRYTFLFIAIVIFIFSIHILLFLFYNLMLETTIFMVFSFLVIFISAQVTNYLLVGNLKNKIKTAFSTYISPELLNKIISSDKPLTAYGEKVDASALFIDVAGFTTFSEKNSVERVVEILNLYLKKFSEAIINNNGWVNKYLGDGLMALFGALDGNENHADQAVKSAFECYNINKELSKEYGLNVRIGVNSGSMIFGSFGADEKKLEFTAIGDCVNSTSRLEGANKFFSTNILVGETAYNLLKNKYELNYIGKFSLKGKDIPNQIYYFCDDDNEYKNNFSKMLESFEKSDLNSFLELVKYFENINFGPAKYYINYYYNNKDKFGKPVKLTEK